MPAYDYRCTRCNLNQEITHSLNKMAVILCNYCNEPMIKLIAAVPAVFKGKGWGKD